MGRALASLIAPHCRAELGVHLWIASSRGRHVFPTIHRARGGDEFPVEAWMAVENGGLRYGVGGAA